MHNLSQLMPVASVQVSRSALRHNLQQLRKLVPASRIMAVIKANAYGHGMLEVAYTLANDVDGFAVARPQEAFSLRQAGINQPILLLEGFFSPQELPRIAWQQLQIVVHSEEQLVALEQAKLSVPVKVWMKLDSGMHRIGFSVQQAVAAYARLTACTNVRQPVNVTSHFSRADEPDCLVTPQQICCFEHFVTDKPGERSLAASSGILLWPQAHFDWVRPGIILYGVSPLGAKADAANFGFRPAMSLVSRLIAVREHPAHSPVGYGGSWVNTCATRIGVVALGYGDGYPQYAPSGTPVLVNGRQVPIAGRVSMDMICVDLGANSQDQAGDPVLLWGEGLPVEQVAKSMQTSVYELITRLTSRLTYQYLD